MKTICGTIGLVLALVGGPCLAGEPRAVESSPKFGTTNDATYKVSAYDFSPTDSTTQYDLEQTLSDFTLSTATPYGAFFASPDLPAGALLEGMSVDACNFNPPGGDAFLVSLEDTDIAGNFLGVLGSVTVAANSGCSSQPVDLSGQNYTVNISHRLLVWTIFGPTPPGGAFVGVGDVTLTYKLQVSRPPLNPTFSDVPVSDPGFRYVEAVAAAGLTAGCGGGLFCPDQSVTRRQMAVFLSRALGLAHRFGETLTSIQIPEWQFRPGGDSAHYQDTGPPQLSRYIVSADPDPPLLYGTVGLPPGALLENAAFDFCDDRPADSQPMAFLVLDAPSSAALVALQSTPGSGCASVSAGDIGYTAGDSKLVLKVSFQDPFGDSQSRLLGARLDYRLQVSLPPATATFGDVPTSDFAFAYVEALAASGITGGCGGGNFCPDNPVTRRQMAIFLAKALGLSFN